MAKLGLANSSFFGLFVCIFLTVCSWIPTTVHSKASPDLVDNKTVCYGSDTGLTLRGDANFRYEQYAKTYNNCQVVIGNLEIVFLDDKDVYYNLSFLSSIEEVTGYVLLTGNDVDYIPLTSLKVIRGQNLYNHENISYSLYVAVNVRASDRSYGLKELRFKELTEILAGYAFFQDNDNLCFHEGIKWNDINPVLDNPVRIYTSSVVKKDCPSCHPSCNGHCWGEGPDMCQKLTRTICHANCAPLSRCFGPNPNQCCSPECAAGCYGPYKNECFACRHYKDNQTCETSCSSKHAHYDKSELKLIKQEKRFAYGSTCVDKCPDHLLMEDGYCVKVCSNGRYAKDEKNCETCTGPCPKTCLGTGNSFLNINSLQGYVGCTTIEGDLKILNPSFEWDYHIGIPGIHPHNLSVLNSVEEITGFLLIQSNHSEFTDLSFLSNLKMIFGRQTSVLQKLALSIMMTPLKSLELRSLKTINNGNVLIYQNTDLCFVNTINWTSILNNGQANVMLNKNSSLCEKEGQVCDRQCGMSGCWGKGPTQCVSCANYMYNTSSYTLCLEDCSSGDGHFYEKSDRICERCHEQCQGSCTGPSNTECHQCANVAVLNTDGQISCEATCGDTMYPNASNYCLPCHPFCKGCTGPDDFVGPGGCTLCEMGKKENAEDRIHCTTPEVQECVAGYFMTQHTLRTSQKSNRTLLQTILVCQKCHPLCINCTLAGPGHCDSCRYVRHEGVCVEKCPSFYFEDEITRECKICNPECRGSCHGPTSTDCIACANYKVYLNSNSTKFNCTLDCPPELPHKVKDEESVQANRIVCADETHPEVRKLLDNSAEEEKKLKIILGTAIPGGIIFLLIIFTVSYMCHKRAQNNMKAAEFTAKITGHEELEPLTPTNTKPDLSKMRIISEEELRRGAIIGSGAFGTVYKGIWIPHGENVKIPVAIKILQEGTSPNQSIELLEEARVMCSVEHICCVRILAVCLNYQMMLVTQLMPHGNLLNYIRTNAQNIGSKALLTWCSQIARGMAYLEERGIVHRDLAARNVLVQTPYQVKITDFGLAKLLNNDDEVYHSSGGLMPIKWLALECINHRIFTHKSDVWSFGVTLWELFTLGKKPYENVRTKDVPLLLEKGERLQQPSMCTIDVYMIMVKCWMLEAESRPAFKELVDEFIKMSRDPGRYLVIEADQLFTDSTFPDGQLKLTPLDVMDFPPRGFPALAAARVLEGDSLMRLPSVSYDKNDLVHGLPDGPENIMDAEEYLQPADPRRMHRPISLARQHSNMSTSSNHFMGESPQSPGTKSLKPQWEGQKIRDKKYSHLNAAARAKQEREHPQFRESVNSRYSSDPIKYVKDRDEIEFPMEDPFPEYTGYTNSEQYDQHEMNYKYPQTILLPVDKDDYLQPGAAAQSLAYLDLDGKGYYQNEKDALAEDPFNEADPIMGHAQASGPMQNGKHLYSNFNPKQAQAQAAAEKAVTNPVYMDGNDIWEPKRQNRNGYQSVSTESESPVRSKKYSLDSYKPMNGSPAGISSSISCEEPQVKPRDTRLRTSESKV